MKSFDPMLEPTPDELSQRDHVVQAVLDAIRRDERIKLPPFDPEVSIPSGFALQTVGIEPNAFSGTLGPFRYQFEGEDDLLHVFVVRLDGEQLSPEEGQRVMRFLLPNLPSALVWLKPGQLSQHFYFGHDELLR